MSKVNITNEIWLRLKIKKQIYNTSKSFQAVNYEESLTWFIKELVSLNVHVNVFIKIIGEKAINVSKSQFN